MPLATHSNSARTKRELRGRIARSRRRIDRQLHALGRDALRLSRWQTYVKQFPGPMIASAFAVGFLASSRRLRAIGGRWVMVGIVEAIWKTIKSQLWDEASSFWAESRPRDSTSTGGDSQEQPRGEDNQSG